MNELNENLVTPMGYLKIFFRRKELLVIPAFIGIIFGICAGMLLPKQYMSSTVLLVKEGKSDNPLFSQLAVSTNVSERMGTIRESMLGWNSLVELVKRLKMDANIKTPQEFENLILNIRSRILIKLRGHNVIQLNFIDANPEMTQSVVQTITDIFIKKNVDIQNQDTSDAIIFIEEQLQVYKGKISSSEIADLKDQLHTLLIDSTEHHPMVKQLKELIASKEKDLVKENLTYTEDSSLNSKTVNPIIQEIKNALTKLEKGTVKTPAASSTGEPILGEEHYKLMLMEKLDNVMARDANVNTGIYNMLLQRLETAKITQRLQSSKEGTRYTILDPARIPFKPIKPNKVLVAIGGAFAGILFGVVFIVIAEFLDKSFIDVEEATQYFGMPLLGAISKINTEKTIRVEKEKQYWMYGLTIIAGIVVVVLAMAVANFIG
ncbi:hypothetical protein MNBD_UNCLBAC01-893 [hydrothermal vent metagenome]|uniref:Tyrosine-protein kinase G-rich domain-containing protein n=1 Tax=hydrothermal vent metagenome TaxID=652676 RepID=A0A3B1DKQ6_9ZZZZ